MLYLDEASTTRPKKEVLKAMIPFYENYWQNPSSLYSPSKNIKSKIEEARYTVGNFIGADGKEIFFTSGGSESNCWAIQGFVNECCSKGLSPIVITSAIEHKSIIDCVKNLIEGCHIVDVDENGFVDINNLEKTLVNALSNGTEEFLDYELLVSIQFANNEIGTIQNIKDIANLVHAYGGVFHTDAVQAFGHIPIDVKELDIDMLSASGHKIGTPKGIGFLYKRDGLNIKPLIYGSQMDGMRGGTENVPYIIGMAKAVELIKRDYCDLNKALKMELNRNHFINRLRELGCTINGSLNNRLPNNINATFSDSVTGESLLYALDLSGIKVSTGSACNSYLIEPSHVLKAIGLSDANAMKTIRFTLPESIDEELIDKVIDEIKKAIKIITI